MTFPFHDGNVAPMRTVTSLVLERFTLTYDDVNLLPAAFPYRHWMKCRSRSGVWRKSHEWDRDDVCVFCDKRKDP